MKNKLKMIWTILTSNGSGGRSLFAVAGLINKAVLNGQTECEVLLTKDDGKEYLITYTLTSKPLRIVR